MKLNDSIKRKFLAGLISISVLPVLLVFAFTLNSNSRFYQEKIMEIGNNEVNYITETASSRFKSLNELITSLIMSTYNNESCLIRISEEESKDNTLTAYDRLMNNRMFEYVAGNLVSNNPYVEGVYLFNESGYTYSYLKGKELGVEVNYKNSNWYKAIQDSPDFETREIYKVEGESTPRVIMGRIFSGEDTNSIVVIVTKDLFLSELLDGKQTTGKLFLVDNNGKLLYSKEPAEINSSDDSKHYIYKNVKNTDWQLVSQIAVEGRTGLYKQNTIYLLVLIILIMIFIGLLIILFNKKYINPIMYLSHVMKHTAGQEKELPSKNVNRTDEIGSLYRGYEKMIKEIDVLIEKQYVSEITNLKMKLQGLMSQINAHFVFNTLENISSLAFIANNKQIAIMSKSLGDMLRYSIDFEKNEETLNAEVDSIMKYISIQEIRFGHTIKVEKNITEELGRSMVPKFILQPIVENAIEHGLVNSLRPWVIKIEASKSDDLFVSIKDNGVGISNEKYLDVCNKIQNDDIRSASIGLTNINRRIKLLYSESYGIEILKSSNQGIEVILHLPLDM